MIPIDRAPVPTRPMFGVAGVIASACLSVAASAQPVNDACNAATPVTMGVPVSGSVVGATNDGGSVCNLEPTPDVFHSFTTPVAGTYTFSLCANTAWDTVLSLHTGCPADAASEVACDDDGCRPPGSDGFGFASSLTVALPAGQTYTVRISGYDSAAAPGLYTLLVIGPAPASGACCLLNVCSVQSLPDCQAIGGEYRGDYTACAVPGGAITAYPAQGGAMAIPDDTPAPGGVVSTITVPDTFTVGDIRLDLVLSHPFAGDLTATLTHAGRTATLFERLGGGPYGDDSNFAGTYTFADSAADTIWRAAVESAPDTSSVIPASAHRAADRYGNTVSLRAAFDGLSSAGAWTLSISDNSEFETGTLTQWSIALDRDGGNPCDASAGACCSGSSCAVGPAISCGGPNRLFAGTGTVCNAPGNLFSPCCKADFNHVNGVTVQDIFDFLNAYFSGQPTADLGGDGVSVQDIFDFLAAFFTGC